MHCDEEGGEVREGVPRGARGIVLGRTVQFPVVGGGEGEGAEVGVEGGEGVSSMQADELVAVAQLEQYASVASCRPAAAEKPIEGQFWSTALKQLRVSFQRVHVSLLSNSE